MRVVIMGAAGRDFHDFNVLYRDDPDTDVVAFTATQIPGIGGRRYPAELAGPRYPDGIPIVDEHELVDLLTREAVDEVAFCYSDIAHVDVMHRASAVLATGAGFRFHAPRRTMLPATVPVVAVVAARTGSGKSQTSRAVGRHLRDAGVRVALVRHPMPYADDLRPMAVQRFATIDDLDAASCTIEELEEYERPVRDGLVVWAGVDYERILHAAEAQSDVIVWDGGNNDLPFFRADLTICVVDPLRPGHEVAYHPGETNLRMADVVLVNKVDSATPAAVAQVRASVAAVNPHATVVEARSPVTLTDGPPLAGRRVLVVEDGPTLTHGGMSFGAGTVAARAAGATELVDPRPFAVGSIAETFARFPHLAGALPAMGYGASQVDDLRRTIEACGCDVVVAGTPVDLTRAADLAVPVRQATYELEIVDGPDLGGLLAPVLAPLDRRGPTRLGDPTDG